MSDFDSGDKVPRGVTAMHEVHECVGEHCNATFYASAEGCSLLMHLCPKCNRALHQNIDGDSSSIPQVNAKTASSKSSGEEGGDSNSVPPPPPASTDGGDVQSSESLGGGGDSISVPPPPPASTDGGDVQSSESLGEGSEVSNVAPPTEMILKGMLLFGISSPDNTDPVSIVINQETVAFLRVDDPLSPNRRTFHFKAVGRKREVLYWYTEYAAILTTANVYVDRCKLSTGDIIAGLWETRCNKPFQALLLCTASSNYEECVLMKCKDFRKRFPNATLCPSDCFAWEKVNEARERYLVLNRRRYDPERGLHINCRFVRCIIYCDCSHRRLLANMVIYLPCRNPAVSDEELKAMKLQGRLNFFSKNKSDGRRETTAPKLDRNGRPLRKKVKPEIFSPELFSVSKRKGGRGEKKKGEKLKKPTTIIIEGGLGSGEVDDKSSVCSLSEEDDDEGEEKIITTISKRSRRSPSTKESFGKSPSITATKNDGGEILLHQLNSTLGAIVDRLNALEQQSAIHSPITEKKCQPSLKKSPSVPLATNNDDVFPQKRLFSGPSYCEDRSNFILNCMEDQVEIAQLTERNNSLRRRLMAQQLGSMLSTPKPQDQQLFQQRK